MVWSIQREFSTVHACVGARVPQPLCGLYPLLVSLSHSLYISDLFSFPLACFFLTPSITFFFLLVFFFIFLALSFSCVLPFLECVCLFLHSSVCRYVGGIVSWNRAHRAVPEALSWAAQDPAQWRVHLPQMVYPQHPQILRPASRHQWWRRKEVWLTRTCLHTNNPFHIRPYHTTLCGISECYSLL